MPPAGPAQPPYGSAPANPEQPAFPPAGQAQPVAQQSASGPSAFTPSAPQVGGPGLAQPAPAPRTPASRRRTVIALIVVAALLLGAVGATIGALNRDVYSAAGFVRTYLGHLAARDAAAALAVPGVAVSAKQLAADELPADASDALLRRAALGTLTDIELVSDTDRGNGRHEVRYSYNAGGVFGESTFDVESAGTRFPLIPAWRFHTSPLSVVNLTVEHSTSFRANGFAVDTRQVAPEGEKPAFNNVVNLQVFTPGRYTFDHESDLLTASPDKLLVEKPAAVDEATVTTAPTDAFIEAVQKAVDDQLDACAEQTVLLPTGCPFGTTIDDRVQGEAAWSLTEYPEIEIEAGEDAWSIPSTPGTAQIEVTVQSLFDGSVKQLNDDVDFDMVGSVFVTGDQKVTVVTEPAPTSRRN